MWVQFTWLRRVVGCHLGPVGTASVFSSLEVEGCSKNQNFPGRSKFFREEYTNLCSNHKLYIKNIFTKKCTSSRKTLVFGIAFRRRLLRGVGFEQIVTRLWSRIHLFSVGCCQANLRCNPSSSRCIQVWYVHLAVFAHFPPTFICTGAQAQVFSLGSARY